MNHPVPGSEISWSLLSSQAGEIIRQETFEGRLHIVVPVVAVREMVLHGDEYLPAEEIAEFVEAWNGVPVIIRHPYDAFGTPISANAPELLERMRVGRLFNVLFEENSLKGEMWIDVERAQALGEEGISVLTAFRENKPMEVSTSYWRELETKYGTFDGNTYEYVAHNLRPDHLAILPDAVGACSWKDGCGAPRVNVLSSSRTPSYWGVEKTPWGSVSKSLAAFVRGYGKARGTSVEVTDVAEASAAFKNWAASKSLLGEAGADNFRDLVFFPVVNPSTNKLNEGALRAVLGGRGAQARISAGALDSARAKARSLLKKHFGFEENEMKINASGSAEPQDGSGFVKFFGGLKDYLLGWDFPAPGGTGTITSTGGTGPVVINAEDIVDGSGFGDVEEEPGGLLPNGKRLAVLLDKMVNDVSDAKHPRNKLLKQMAEAAGVGLDKMEQILNGEVDFLPRRWLGSFVETLGVDYLDLLVAALEDKEEYMESIGASTTVVNEASGETVEETAEAVEEVEETVATVAEKGENELVSQNHEGETEEDMTKCEMVSSLIENEGTSFKEEDRSWLASLEESQLKKLAPVVETAAAPPAQQEAVPAPATPQEVFSSITDNSLREVLEDGYRLREAQRAELMRKIVTNSTFVEEELKNKSTGELRKLEALVQKAEGSDYSGSGGPRDNATVVSSDGEVPLPPSILWGAN